METRLLTIRETARLLGVSPPTVRVWLRQGHLRAVRLGSRRRVPFAEVLRLTQGARDDGSSDDRRYD